MPRKRKQISEIQLPSSHLVALSEAGFTVVRYLNEAVMVGMGGDATRLEWLPSLCIAPGDRENEYRVIEWMPVSHPANHYNFSGWLVSNGNTFGGLCESIGQALWWFKWHAESKTRSIGNISAK